MDPMSDPEFAEFYRKNIESMRNNYGKALEDAKSQLADICGFEAQ
jgi:ABC-type Zn uptake system ZnuABC Zn-binding protein ZnuA